MKLPAEVFCMWQWLGLGNRHVARLATGRLLGIGEAAPHRRIRAGLRTLTA